MQGQENLQDEYRLSSVSFTLQLPKLHVFGAFEMLLSECMIEVLNN